MGETEVREFTQIESQPHLRLMQPMITQEGCLKCHGHQGYQVGDVRGGVSVAVPLASYLAEERQMVTTYGWSLGLLWLIGLTVITLGARRLRRSMRERDQAQEALQAAHDGLEIQVEERTSELRELHDGLEIQVQERTRELRDAQEQLVRREKLAVLGQMAGGVSHELRNPLGLISNAVYYLEMVNPDADDTTKEYLHMISSEVHNADKIISDLLDFGRTRPAEREEIAVSALVDRALERRPPPEGVQVTTQIGDDLPPAYVDPHQIELVLGNLVTNAYQAMPDGGQLTISARRGDPRGRPAGDRPDVSISITDTGCGISPENMEKLFEPLFTTKARGIGLGLAVSRNLAQANGGTIEVESTEGEGSTFTVILPTDEREWGVGSRK